MKLPEVVKIKFVTVCNDIDDKALQFLDFMKLCQIMKITMSYYECHVSRVCSMYNYGTALCRSIVSYLIII